MESRQEYVCDMSRLLVKKRVSAALRKQRQRARLRQSGKSKVEPWITPKTKELMNAFGSRIGMDLQAVAELVLEAATPLFLGEISRRLDALEPLMTRIRDFEHWGFNPSKVPTLPVRISGATGNVELDPQEYLRLLESAYPLVSQLERYGVNRPMISRIASRKVGRSRSK